ncbi:MAG: UDP-N-acetylglucosamine--N-acetylmuramyl-(pentapeptide) pyrophosphoryl-undecaprenol N-acetylglucosamine transferase [Parachlamydiales bacterium]|nr:UDP-N-acetylglucosamine--N-acetylmuramyl-(pentapeptide) pyrophosphoryl-undecaprenol N-acetylglucosamine transferase [Parachlamydiales bacterium]
MSGEKKKKILISASGTGGHLIPAQDLAKILDNNNFEVFFAAYDLSKKSTFDKNRYQFKDIQAQLPSKKTIFSFLIKTLIGVFQSVFFIFKTKPEVVVGFGSYHTFPVILAATILRKKVILFDSNTILGKVNQFFSKKAKVVAVQFPLQKRLANEILVKRLPWTNLKVFENKTDLFQGKNLKNDLFTILIFGGSQGSKIINDNFLRILNDFKNLKLLDNFQIIHICGNDQDESFFKKTYHDLNILAYVAAFEKNLISFMKHVDLVISRSGASTISELIHFEIPSILIPFKKAKDNHQFFNAKFLQDEVLGAKIVLEDFLDEKSLLNALMFLLENNRKNLLAFKENIKKFKNFEKNKNIKNFSEIIMELYGK